MVWQVINVEQENKLAENGSLRHAGNDAHPVQVCSIEYDALLTVNKECIQALVSLTPNAVVLQFQ